MSTLLGLRETLSGIVHDEDDAQVRAVLGNAAGDLDGLAAFVEAAVHAGTGQQVLGCVYQYVSVGVTLELALDGGSRCVVKATRPRPDEWAALALQDWLAKQGFPAPRVLAGPKRFGDASVHVMESLPRGDTVAYGEPVRDLMARELARLVTLAGMIDPWPELAVRVHRDARLWATPHSAIFDFAGTAQTATPIDAIARAAKDRLHPGDGPRVIAHCDWSLQNIAVEGDELVGVFDWDNVSITSELSAVVGAAAFHQQDWRVGPGGAEHFYPDPDWTLGFVDSYAAARGRPWAKDEREALGPELVYRLAYQARCEHALEPGAVGPAVRRLLRFATHFGLG